MGNAALISEAQVDDIVARTGAAKITVLRRVVGLDVRGAARVAIDRELERLGIRLVVEAVSR